MAGFNLDEDLNSQSNFSLDDSKGFSFDRGSFSFGDETGAEGVAPPAQTLFENVIDIFNKSSSLGLNAAGELIGLESVKDVDVMDIIRGTKFVDTNSFKNDLIKKVGLKPISNDGFINNASNFVLNFAVESALDPLTWVPGMALIKGLGKGRNLTKTAISSILTRGVVGSAIGLSGARLDENALSNSLNAIGRGFAVGALSHYLTKDGVKALGKLGDTFYDAMTKSTLGDEYFSMTKAGKGLREIKPSEAFRMQKEFDKHSKIMKDAYLETRTSFFKDMKASDTDSILESFTKTVDSAKSDSVILRNKLIDFTLKEKNKLIPEGSKTVKKLNLSELNEITAKVNTSVGQQVDAVLKKSGDTKMRDFVNRYVHDNRELIKKFNIERPKLLNKLGSNEQVFDVVPLDFHSTEILLPDSIKDIYRLKDDAKHVSGMVQRVMEDTSGFLTLDKRIKTGADNFTRSMADRLHKKAFDINRAIEVNGTKVLFGEKNGGKFDNAINAWDKYRRLWKSSVLLASTSWIKNNMFENSVRAMMKLGVKRGAGVAFDQLPVSKTFRKLFKMTSPNNGFKHLDVADESIYLANKVGVLDTNFFDDMLKRTGSETRLAKLNAILAKTENPDDILKIKKMIKKETPGKIAKTIEGYQNVLNNTVGRYGRTVENGARVSFFNDIVNHRIAKNKNLLKIVKEKGILNVHESIPEIRQIIDDAKDLTNETFFDYSNLSAFEEKVLKRIVPFYSFYSKNLAFYLREIENNGAGILKTVRAIRSTGRAPTEEERKGIPDWMLDSFYRISNDGNDIIQTPNVSLVDALDNFSARNFGGKLDPVLKTIVENLRNKEFGLDQNVRPSGSKFGTKKLFSRSLALESVLPGTGRDKKGNLITTSDFSGTIDNIRGNLAPVPILDQILGSRNDVVNKGKDTAVTIGNKVLPIRQRERLDLFKRTVKRRKGSPETER